MACSGKYVHFFLILSGTFQLFDTVYYVLFELDGLTVNFYFYYDVNLASSKINNRGKILKDFRLKLISF
jgi:hypothetical protein